MAFKRFFMAFIMIWYFLFNYIFNNYAYPACSREGAYLFCYFVGNEVNEQQIHLAVSTDGYNFKALNNNEPIIDQKLGTGCVRDPYILKGQDENGKDCYFIIATDMNALEGWTSNHCLITWKSYDLVNWIDETVIDIRQFEGFEHTNRAWAPQAIWDEKAGMYMVYWATSTVENDVAGHYYAYHFFPTAATAYTQDGYPRLYLQVTSTNVQGDQATQYIMTKNFNGSAFTAFEAGKIYRVNYTFPDSLLEDPLICAEVNITVTPWTVVELTPDWN